MNRTVKLNEFGGQRVAADPYASTGRAEGAKYTIDSQTGAQPHPAATKEGDVWTINLTHPSQLSNLGNGKPVIVMPKGYQHPDYPHVRVMNAVSPSWIDYVAPNRAVLMTEKHA